MPPVGVIVDVVIAAPEENGIVVVAHVLVGQQNIAGQRAEEGVHFAVESVMEFLQKSIVVLLLFRQAAPRFVKSIDNVFISGTDCFPARHGRVHFR